MNLPLFIAGRYLFAKKSHNVINIISAISSIGIAIGTAALIIILSVYNGFDQIIRDSLDETVPDLLITPANAKVFQADSSTIAWLQAQKAIVNVSSILEDNVFMDYDGEQSIIRVKGVEDVSLSHGELPLCAVGTGLAYEMGINPNFVAQLRLYYPAAGKNISLSNPTASLNEVRVKPSRLFSVNTAEENRMVHIPLQLMRELTGYTDKSSALAISLDPELSPKQIKTIQDDISLKLGSDYMVKDRLQQNEALFKMMKYEKASIFLILIFIIIIVAFNIFGTLTMLIIEKKQDIVTLYSLGATEKTIKRIFSLEGWLVSLVGLAAGLILGLLFAFLQQQFGFIKMPGNMVIDSYPIIIKGSDLLITSLGVALIGYIISILPVRTSGPKLVEASAPDQAS